MNNASSLCVSRTTCSSSRQSLALGLVAATLTFTLGKVLRVALG